MSMQTPLSLSAEVSSTKTGRSGSPDSEHPNYSNIEMIKKKISDDALHGALRIAGLVRYHADDLLAIG